MNEEPMQDEASQYPYGYPYEPLIPYPPEYQYQPASWYPMSVYQPMFWAALIGGIADVAGVILLGSQAIGAVKKVLKKDGEEKS